MKKIWHAFQWIVIGAFLLSALIFVPRVVTGEALETDSPEMKVAQAAIEKGDIFRDRPQVVAEYIASRPDEQQDKATMFFIGFVIVVSLAVGWFSCGCIAVAVAYAMNSEESKPTLFGTRFQKQVFWKTLLRGPIALMT